MLDLIHSDTEMNGSTRLCAVITCQHFDIEALNPNKISLTSTCHLWLSGSLFNGIPVCIFWDGAVVGLFPSQSLRCESIRSCFRPSDLTATSQGREEKCERVVGVLDVWRFIRTHTSLLLWAARSQKNVADTHGIPLGRWESSLGRRSTA